MDSKLPSPIAVPVRRQLLEPLRAARARAWAAARAWRREQGWRYSPLHLYGRAWNMSFDLFHGVSTRSISDAAACTHAGPGYEASPVYSFRRLLRRLDIDFADYAFVDFGSGKGRALLLAGELPFKEVIGVEFSSALNDVATRNISRYRRRRAQGVVSLHCDAAAFELPDDNLVLYFFNPFSADVLDRVMANILASIERKPRQAIIIFLCLRNPELFDRLPRFTRQAWHRYVIYTWSPA
jgi:SAM-dependent methyltransferase